jgi:Glycosyl transferases group 1
MALKILCSGHLVRYPLGGHSWHHLQYLVGFRRLGHEVTFFEHYGWPDSCYDPARDEMTADPSCGIAFLRRLLEPHRLGGSWCYLAEDGTAHGMPRDRLAQICRECDVYFNLSNINAIPEVAACRRRALVDTDPAFTQIGGHGMGGPFSGYHRLFTYGENVHRPGCTMPTGGMRWLPTRQPVVLDLWPFTPADPEAPFTTVMNWSGYGDRVHAGRLYGQKDRSFAPFFRLPRETGVPMEMAVNAPPEVHERLAEGGWRLADPLAVAGSPASYQQYLARSRAEFCVAKHGYVATRCGWFSDRSAAYLAMGRPVVVEDTGFSDYLPCGRGLLPFRSHAEAVSAIRRLPDAYADHCRAARAIAEEHFDARRVLTSLLERSL